MKKYIAIAVAAGALAAGSAASAQDLGTVIGSLFGFGQPTYTYPGSSAPIPAVVAGTTPYYGTTPYGSNRVFVDQYGRQVYIDQYGRQVLVQSNAGTYGITGYDAWGRPVYGTVYGNVASVNPQDRDGDGVWNVRDRWPNDPRYW